MSRSENGKGVTPKENTIWYQSLQRAGLALRERRIDTALNELEFASNNRPTQNKDELPGFFYDPQYSMCIPHGVVGLAYTAVTIYQDTDAAYRILNFVEEKWDEKGTALEDTWFELSKEAIKQKRFEDASVFFRRSRDAHRTQYQERIPFFELWNYCRSYIRNWYTDRQYADAAGALFMVARNGKDPEVGMMAERLARKLLDGDAWADWEGFHKAIRELDKALGAPW